MLEGKEVAGEIGAGGSYSIDVDANGFVLASASYKEGSAEALLSFRLDVIDLLKKAALKTDNTLDDSMVSMISAALGR